jgi:hypothetical protein
MPALDPKPKFISLTWRALKADPKTGPDIRGPRGNIAFEQNRKFLFVDKR